ncbi:MAG: hypothetical protein WB767_05060 [Nocardioides sp.]
MRIVALLLALGFVAPTLLCIDDVFADLRVGAAIERGEVERRPAVLGEADDERKSSRSTWQVAGDDLTVNSAANTQLFVHGARPVQALFVEDDLVAVDIEGEVFVSETTGTEGAITSGLRGALCLLLAVGLLLVLVHVSRPVPRTVSVVALSGAITLFLACVMNGSGLEGSASLGLLAIAWPVLGVVVARRWFRKESPTDSS